jgi:hypothetical protein
MRKIKHRRNKKVRSEKSREAGTEEFLEGLNDHELVSRNT